jgi:prepilin-type N-terminal cleavage/methylation domain-containing protein
MGLRYSNEKGFTMAELIVVMMVLSILIAFAVPRLFRGAATAEINRQQSDILHVKNAAFELMSDYSCTDFNNCGSAGSAISITVLINEGKLTTEEWTGRKNQYGGSISIAPYTSNPKYLTVTDTSLPDNVGNPLTKKTWQGVLGTPTFASGTFSINFQG